MTKRSSRKIVKDLIAGWDETVTADDYEVTTRATGARKRHRSDAQTVLIAAYGAHVHDTARLLLGYLPDHLTVAPHPLFGRSSRPRSRWLGVTRLMTGLRR